MTRYLARRLAHLVVVLWGAVTVVFLILHLGGDPTAILLPDAATAEQRVAVTRELGLDQALHVQYLRFLARSARGDFGISYRQERPVMDVVLERLPATLELSLVAVTLATVAGTVLGVLGALWRGRLYDRLLIGTALLGQSVPTFWLGILLILVFAANLRWLPASGAGSLRHLVLPAVSLAAFTLARTARIARASMIEVLAQDYVRTARAKGLSERAVVLRHALKNASISVVTVTAFTFSTLIGGAIVTESIFAWPGVGSLIVDSVLSRDYPIVLAAVFVTALFVAVTSLLADLVYAVLDPRITFGRQ